MVLLAHAGHWAIWVLYSVPVVIVLASIVISLIRDRGHGGAEDPDHSGRADHFDGMPDGIVRSARRSRGQR